MQKTVISTRQAFFLAMPLLLIIGHFFLVPIYLKWAGRDAWIGVMAAFAVGVIIFLAMGKLQEGFGGKTLIELALRKLGPWAGRLAVLPLIAYFFVLSVITLYGFSVFVSSAFMTTHPQLLITVSFALVMMYLVHLGIEVIARVSEWVLLYNIVSGLLVSLALHNRKDYSKLLPMLQHGVDPIIPVILLVLAVFGELIVMLMVNVGRREDSSYTHTKVYLILFAVSMVIFPSTTAGPVAIFGVEQARNLPFPVESSVRLISVGFIERFDIYGLTIMTVSALLRLSLLHYATSMAVAQWLSLKNYKGANWLLGGALVAASMFSFRNYLELMDFLRSYYPYGILFSGVILILWLLMAISAGRKKR